VILIRAGKQMKNAEKPRKSRKADEERERWRYPASLEINLNLTELFESWFFSIESFVAKVSFLCGIRVSLKQEC